MLDCLADLYLVFMASFCKWSSNDDILMSGMSCWVQNMYSCFAQRAQAILRQIQGNNTTNSLILICVITYDTQQRSAADDSWSMNDIVKTSTGLYSKMSIEF